MSPTDGGGKSPMDGGVMSPMDGGAYNYRNGRGMSPTDSRYMPTMDGGRGDIIYGWRDVSLEEWCGRYVTHRDGGRDCHRQR